MNARSFTPHATRTQTIHFISHRRVAEEPESYRENAEAGAGGTERKGAAKRIEIEALRRTADVQIGRLLRLANLLDELDGEPLQSERELATNGMRDAATALEQHLHTLADALEKAL